MVEISSVKCTKRIKKLVLVNFFTTHFCNLVLYSKQVARFQCFVTIAMICLLFSKNRSEGSIRSNEFVFGL